MARRSEADREWRWRHSRLAMHNYWRALVRAEIRKLYRRGEQVNDALLAYADAGKRGKRV